MHHINPKTGDVNRCRASVQSCPFGAENHYDSAEEARAAYELDQKAFRAAVTSDLKHLDHVGLHQATLQEAAALGIAANDLAELDFSIDLATKLHEGQTRKADVQGRKNTPYIEHPLRNTLRLIRLGVKDIDVLKAAVLHDTVEDCGKRFGELYHPGEEYTPAEARTLLGEHLRNTFGQRTQGLVLAVTNPLQSSAERRKLSQEEKHENYRREVAREIAASAEIYLVKLADIIDNAGSLHHALPEELASARRLADKYLPLMRTFMDQLEAHRPALLKSGLTEERLGFIREKLLRTETRLEDLLAAA